MTREEFTERTGLTPTSEEYQHIEAMYMAAGNMDKDELALHEEQQRVRRGAGHGPQNRRIRDRR